MKNLLHQIFDDDSTPQSIQVVMTYPDAQCVMIDNIISMTLMLLVCVLLSTFNHNPAFAKMACAKIIY